MNLEARIAHFQEKKEELETQLSDPQIAADVKAFVALQRAYGEADAICKEGALWKQAREHMDSAKALLREEKDEDVRNLAKEEIEDLEKTIETQEEKLRLLLVPKDPEDHRNAVLEIRGGTGGDEAAIFAGDLLRMYERFCENEGFKVVPVDATPGTSGGYKEVIVNIEGNMAYGTLKFESGVHRVQRVPATETQGRIHTSAATVVVLPEADEVDVHIDPKDIRKDTFCSSGAGGQSVNTTYSAVRLTHLPTGLVVSCQDERSQLRNFDKAMQVLRSRLFEKALREKQAELSGKRKSMVSTGDRSAKIRTYNFPQSRLTDHRINLSVYNLPEIMNGQLMPIIKALQTTEQAEKLQEALDG